MDDFYREYVNGAIDVETAARKCFEILRENEISSADMGYVMDFEKIRKDISYKVINFEENSKLLENLVYSRFTEPRLFMRSTSLKKIAEKLGERFYILPSSVHELILIKDDGICELEHLKDMVHAVNRTAVMPEEVLSDNVYVYDNTIKSVSIA